MSCSSFAPNGANVNCSSYLKEVKAAIIMPSGGRVYDADSLDNLATFKTAISELTAGYVVEFDGKEVTPSEAQTETTGDGTNIIVAENSPTLLGYLKTNNCDFVQMKKHFNGQGSYDVLLYNAGGVLIATQSGSLYKGFQTQVYAHAYGAIGRDNQTQQYRLTLNFLDAEEWRNDAAVKVNYTLFDLKALMPIGLKANPIVELTADTGSTPVSVRCVDNSELSEVLTGEVMNTNAVGVTITPTYNATTEVYDCVVTKTGAADLAFGEYAECRLVSKTGSVYDQVSNWIKFKGNA